MEDVRTIGCSERAKALTILFAAKCPVFIGHHSRSLDSDQ